jgi:hypothetical protein
MADSSLNISLLLPWSRNKSYKKLQASERHALPPPPPPNSLS